MPIVPSRKSFPDIVAALLVLAQDKTPSSSVSGSGTLLEQQQELKRLLEKQS